MTDAPTRLGVDERLAFDTESAWWGEHVARYEHAVPLAAGKQVLDVACGSGFGLLLLERHAAEATGLDRDEASVRTVRERITQPRTRVEAGDACAMPFPGSSFDVVVSFETIEHLVDRRAFVRELRRVLRPEGTLLLSTPNALVTKPIAGRPRNPYHLFEYTPDELVRELSAQFSEVTLSGQALDARFVIPPFRDLQEALAPTPWNRLGVALRRVLHRMPTGARERLSRAIWHHPFFPGAGDYRFSRERITDATVLLAECRGIRT